MHLFYEKTRDEPPEKTLLKALDQPFFFDAPPFALDVGCGAGRDTLWLLKQGWRVLAIDQNPLAFDHIHAQGIHEDSPLSFMSLEADFEKMNLSDYPQANLINASYSLPFCQPTRFLQLWEKLITHLKRGGLFSGQFFGVEHSWAIKGSEMTFHTETTLLTLLNAFNIVDLEEEKEQVFDVEENPVS